MDRSFEQEKRQSAVCHLQTKTALMLDNPRKPTKRRSEKAVGGASSFFEKMH